MRSLGSGVNAASKMMETPVDRSILKVHLPNGGFNMVKYGDATDIKVRLMQKIH